MSRCRSMVRAQLIMIAAISMVVAMPSAVQAAAPPTPPCPDKVSRLSHADFDHSGRIMISPPQEELTVVPGSVQRKCITIGSRLDDPISITLTMTDAEAADSAESGVKFVPNSPFGNSGWIRLAASSIKLAPGDDVTIPYTITVPSKPPTGTIAGGIRVTVAPTSTGKLLMVAQRLVEQIFLTVKGTVKHGGRITHVDGPHLIQHGSHASFDVVYQNDGNVIDHFAGDLVIKSSISGHTVKSLPLDSHLVYRGGSGKVHVVWFDPPWIGRFQPTVTVRSQAGTFKRQLPAIWVIPPVLYDAIAASLVVLLVGSYALTRRRRKHNVDGDIDEV